MISLSFRRRLTVLTLLLATLAAPAARASSDQETLLQDDNLLLYSPPATVAATLDTLKGLGVDRVRLTIKWDAIAPKPRSYTKPAFNAADPAAYPANAWAPYDAIVELAQSKGIGVDFNVTAPAPFWATAKGAPNDDDQAVWRPSPTEFGLFVTALGIRYSGGYSPPAPPAGTKAAPGLGGLLGGRVSVPGTPDPPLPRVAYWSIWNEPNQPGWLLPQAVRNGSSWSDFAAMRYRELVDAAGAALKLTAHGGDTILIGETAPSGVTNAGTLNPYLPLRFLRDLYCVGRSLKPLKGAHATSIGCPAAGAASRFAAAHPLLFSATGIAHHPYALIFPPATPSPTPDQVTLADLQRLAHTLVVVFKRAGHRRAGGVPIYLTEYGYQTKPPDPTQIYSTRQQAAFLNQADYIAFRDPRVKALSQFQLNDDAPNSKVKPGTRYYWSTFQSGLRLHSAKNKQSFAAYRMPVYVIKRSRRRLTLFGIVRPAANGAHFDAHIVFRPTHGKKKSINLRTVRVRSSRGSFIVTVKAPRAGIMRVAWKGLFSRAVHVR